MITYQNFTNFHRTLAKFRCKWDTVKEHWVCVRVGAEGTGEREGGGIFTEYQSPGFIFFPKIAQVVISVLSCPVIIVSRVAVTKIIQFMHGFVSTVGTA